MADKLRVGMIGGGNVLDWHAPALLAMEDRCTVVAAAEKSPQRHERIRNTLKNPGLPIYESYEEMLEAETLDVVDVLLPHFLHMDACIQAAEHGCHVLTEKVMARNTYECRRMIEACERNHVQLGVAHDRRHQSDWVAFKKLVDSGVLGKVLVWKLECNAGLGSYTQNTAVQVEGNNWLGTVDSYGGGAIMGNLTHQIDGLRFFAGEFEQVYCTSLINPAVGLNMQGEASGILSGTLQNGAIYRLTVDWVVRAFDWAGKMQNPLWYEMIEASGEKGDAYFIHGKGTFFHEKDSLEYQMVSNSGEVSGHAGLIEAFINSLLGRPSCFTSFGADSLKTVEVAEAAYIAEAEGRSVHLPLGQSTPWEERTYLR